VPISREYSGERPTLKTIASLTGLSVASVSRALKDAADIGEDTKARVRKVAQEVGYRPNRAGVRLRTGRTNVIALVLAAENDVMDHTAQLIYATSMALRGTQFHMIIIPFFHDEMPMTPIRYIWETGSADGVIINQVMPDDPRVAFLHENHIPFATHGRTDMGIEHPYFDFDNAEYSRLLVRELVARGRTRLALLAPPIGQAYGKLMVEGFLEEAKAHGVVANVFPDICSDQPHQQIEQGVSRYLKTEPRPDGIIAGSSTAAMSIVAAAERAQMKLGRDFDLGAKEAIPILHRFRPEIIVVREKVSLAGDFLARAVVDAIANPEAPVMQGLEVPVLHGRENY
jgi:LacI family transcriptional regulator